MVNEELQRKYIELQTKEHHAQRTQEQLVNIFQHIKDLKEIENTLNEVEKTKKGTEILVPLGIGIFARADLKENKELFVSVGSKVNVTKSIDETKNLINNQLRNMENLAAEVENKLHETSLELQNIQRDIMKSIESKEQ